jgi:hypothetical protein
MSAMPTMMRNVKNGMITGGRSSGRNMSRPTSRESQLVGMLSAIPKTPLHARLAAADRLDPADDPALGTNIVPLQMTREALSDGYVRLMGALYEPQAYFERVDEFYVAVNIEFDRAWRSYAAKHAWQRRLRHLRFWVEAFGLLARLLWRVPDPALRRIYRRRFWGVVLARRDPVLTRVYAIKCALHYHIHQMAHLLAARDRPMVNTF